MSVDIRRLAAFRPDEPAIRAYLMEREVVHNMLLTVLDRAVRNADDKPVEGPDQVFSISHSSRVIAVFVCTLARKILWSNVATSDLQVAVGAVARTFELPEDALTGTYGPEPVAGLFAHAWSRSTGHTASVAMEYRHFELERVILPAMPPGTLRAARETDVDVLVQFANEFITETRLPDEDRARASPQRTLERVRRGEFHVWEADGTIATTASVGGTPRVGRIGFVYTPPAMRKRGFASATVAALSSRLLDAGAWRVSLTTDPRNPTSNRIYQAIGFQHIGDGSLYAFTPR